MKCQERAATGEKVERHVGGCSARIFGRRLPAGGFGGGRPAGEAEHGGGPEGPRVVGALGRKKGGAVGLRAPISV